MIVYLDNAATTRVCPEAVSAAVEAMDVHYGNPSSVHRLGLEAEKLLTGARGAVADALGCTAEEVYFTSGGTEADNWALRAGTKLGRRRGKHLITTQIEHDAVLNTAKALEQEGWEVTYLAPGPDGRVTAEAFAAALRPDTVLASVMLVNNETGARQPVEALAGLLHRQNPGALFHTDAVQAFLKEPFSPAALGADLVSVSAHKVHGPKGVGALYVRKGVKLPPLLLGGGQERGLRSGTEGLPQIAAFGAACRVYGDCHDRVAALHARLTVRVTEEVPQARLLPTDTPYLLSLSLPGYRGEVLMNYLESRDIFVSRGSACAKGRRSHVLTAMGLPADRIDGTIRVSLSRLNTEADIDAFCDALRDAADTLAHR